MSVALFYTVCGGVVWKLRSLEELEALAEAVVNANLGQVGLGGSRIMGPVQPSRIDRNLACSRCLRPM